MTFVKIVPLIIMAESVIASIIYFVSGDIRHGVYWMAGAALTASVIF